MNKFWVGSVAVALLLAASTASAQDDHYVQGYYRSNGTYVAPHYQTNPNGTRNDNYSTRGNTNPYTGEPGTKRPDGESPQSGYHPYGQTPTPYGSQHTSSSYRQAPANSSYPTPAPYPQ